MQILCGTALGLLPDFVEQIGRNTMFIAPHTG